MYYRMLYGMLVSSWTSPQAPFEGYVMDIRKADHVALLIKNVERSRQFYTQVLGIRVIPRPESFHFPGAWLTRGIFRST
jgi:catechol-2,3-dioxygenase